MENIRLKVVVKSQIKIEKHQVFEFCENHFWMMYRRRYDTRGKHCREIHNQFYGHARWLGYMMEGLEI